MFAETILRFKEPPLPFIFVPAPPADDIIDDIYMLRSAPLDRGYYDIGANRCYKKNRSDLSDIIWYGGLGSGINELR
jgi:hypothetical protein